MKVAGALVLVAFTVPLFSILESSVAWGRGAQTLRVEVSLVTVGVRVTGAKGRDIPNLRISDFELYEDGVAQKISLFANDAQPISLGILLDHSDSMWEGGKLERAKAAAWALVDTGQRDNEYLFIALDCI